MILTDIVSGDCAVRTGNYLSRDRGLQTRFFRYCPTPKSLACVASVPAQAKCYVSRASEDSGRAKIGARAKKGKENLRWHATHSTSLARERLPRRLITKSLAARVHCTILSIQKARCFNFRAQGRTNSRDYTNQSLN